MAATSTTETWDAAWTLTMRAKRKRLTDNISDAYPTVGRFRRSGIMEVENGGKEIQEDLMYGLGSSEWFDGFDVLSTDSTDGITAAFEQFRYNATPIVISMTEEREARKSDSAVKLLEAKTKQAMTKSMDTINAAIHGAQSGKSIVGLQDICAEGTSTTLHSIAVSSNSWWDNQRTDFNGSYTSFSTQSNNRFQGPLGMGVVWNNASEANDKTNLIITSMTYYGEYEALFEGTGYTRFVKSGSGRSGPGFGLGAEGDISFRGAPVIGDRDCVSDSMYLLNTKYLKLKIQGGLNFAKTPFKEPTNQLAKVAFVVVGVQLMTNNRRRHGLLYNIT